MAPDKQLVLRPQDLVVAAKLALAGDRRDFTLSAIAIELDMAVSAVHGSIKRAEAARLVTRAHGSIRAVRATVREFLLYGAKYAFPAVSGPMTRGVLTGVGAPFFAAHFDQSKQLAPVWPHASGAAYGPSIAPLHASVPAAAMVDPDFYELMALFDAVRAGAARERELAVEAISGRLS